MFFFRKLVGAVLTPSTLTVAALVLGALLLAFQRTARRGRWVAIGGVASLLFLSLGIPFDAIGGSMEGRHPALLAPAALPDVGRVRWVVVLGGGHRSAAVLPPSSPPNEASIYRIVEGVRLHRAIPGSRLLFSGNGGRDSVSSARVGADLAAALGVNEDQMIMEEAPRTTSEEADQIRSRIGAEPFVLVTSALHMPQAVRIFAGAGLNPIPAPTGHLAHARRKSLADWLAPSPRRLLYADAVVHELLELVAVRLGRP